MYCSVECVRLLEKQGVEGASAAFTTAINGLAGAPEVVRDLVSQVVDLGVPLDETTRVGKLLSWPDLFQGHVVVAGKFTVPVDTVET